MRENDRHMEELVERSLEVLRENQSESGAFIASPTFSQYGYSWLRDGYFCAKAALMWDQVDIAESFLLWATRSIEGTRAQIETLQGLLESGQPPKTGWFPPARFNLDGSKDESSWPNHQNDGYGSYLLLLAECARSSHRELSEGEHRTALLVYEYLRIVWDRPCSDCWEEFEDKVHLSTLAALCGGLKAISCFMGNDRKVFRDLAKQIERSIRSSALSHGYYPKYLGSDQVDASEIWLSVPYAVLAPQEPELRRTIEKIEEELENEGGVKRYAADTYYGGGQWPILSAFLGWHHVRCGNPGRAWELLDWVCAQQDERGFLPEQVDTFVNNPRMVGPWERRWGSSALPLVWSHAMFLILYKELVGYTTHKER